jgi:hypothetical protein
VPILRLAGKASTRCRPVNSALDLRAHLLMLFIRPRRFGHVAAGIGACLLLFPIASTSQTTGPWSLAIVSALLEEFRDGDLLEKDVVRNVSFYLHTQSGAVTICLAAAAGGCKAVLLGQPSLRLKGRYRISAYPRSANASAPPTTASVAILDTVTSRTLHCSVTSFESRTETPRNAVCTTIRN